MPQVQPLLDRFTDQDGFFRIFAFQKEMEEPWFSNLVARLKGWSGVVGVHHTPNYTLPYFYYTILYYTILYYTILYYTVLYYTILYYTILYYTILYYTILYCIRLYYTIPYYTTILKLLHYITLYCTTLYYIIVYHTMLYQASAQLLNFRGPVRVHSHCVPQRA